MGFRIGTTRTCPAPEARRPVSGVALRAMQERADAAWVLSTHPTEAEARAEEAVVSLRYQLPTLPFKARKGKSVNGVVSDQSLIDRIFGSVDTYSAGNQLLLDRHLAFEEPHHVPRTWEGRRRNVTITLCGDRRGRTPMHTVAVGGRDPEAALVLERIGLSVRPAKSGGQGWRYESCFKEYREAMEIVDRIASVAPCAHPAGRPPWRVRRLSGNEQPAVHPGAGRADGNGDVRRGRRIRRRRVGRVGAPRRSRLRPRHRVDAQLRRGRTGHPQFDLRLPWRGHHEHPRISRTTTSTPMSSGSSRTTAPRRRS